MSAQTEEGGVGSPAATAVARKAGPRGADRPRHWSLAGGVLGLTMLGACACAGAPAPGPLMVGGRLSAAFTDFARDELQASFWLAPTLAAAAPASGTLPPPRARLASVLPPPEPVGHDRIAWIPQLEPARGPAPEPSAGPRIALWPPPWKPAPADLRLAAAPAAGPPEDPRSALWPAPWKPDSADLPVAVAHAAGLHDDPARADGRVPVVVARGVPVSPAIDGAIAVSDHDQLLSQLDRAAREALLAGDAATALTIYERLAARFPEERTVWLGRALALERLGRGSEARALYQAMLGDDPEDLGVKIALLGIVAEHAPDEALRLLRRLAHQHPDDARLRAQIAAVLARHGALPAAIAEQRRALALAPANLGYRINLAILHDRAGAIDDAVEHYRSALELATLGGAPTAQLDAIAARLHHLRTRQRPAASNAPR